MCLSSRVITWQLLTKKVTQKWSSMIGFHLIGYIIKNKATSKIFTQGNFLHFLTK